MRPLLFWTFYAFAKLKFAVDFGFSWSLLVVMTWLVGLNPTFQKPFPIRVRVSDLYVCFCTETGIIRTRLGTFSLKFSKVRKKPFLFSSFLIRAWFRARWGGCMGEKPVEMKAQHRTTRKHCPQHTHVASAQRGPCSRGWGLAQWAWPHSLMWG